MKKTVIALVVAGTVAIAAHAVAGESPSAYYRMVLGAQGISTPLDGGKLVTRTQQPASVKVEAKTAPAVVKAPVKKAVPAAKKAIAQPAARKTHSGVQVGLAGDVNRYGLTLAEQKAFHKKLEKEGAAARAKHAKQVKEKQEAQKAQKASAAKKPAGKEVSKNPFKLLPGETQAQRGDRIAMLSFK